MKIVIINGSARRGNTLTAIDAFIKGASEKNEIEIIQPDRLHIAPCKGCGVCQCYKGCIDQDDTNPTIDKITAADVILFATPVYWWGMSAQLKLIIDKCYCRGLQLKNKKVGTIVVGGSPVDSIQYELIDSGAGLNLPRPLSSKITAMFVTSILFYQFPNYPHQYLLLF